MTTYVMIDPAELAELRKENAELKATLLSRHGGEPLALLAELDAERAENARLRADRDAIDLILRDVAELPDRTSPDDWPEALLVTAEELREILERHLSVEGAK